MFERFTEPSKAVLVTAQELAIELGSPYVDVGHLLYGCAETREPTAGRPLRDAGVTGVLVRARLARGTAGADAARSTPGTIDPEALAAIGIDLATVRRFAEETFGPGALDATPARPQLGRRTRRPGFTTGAKRTLEQALRAAVELHHKRLEPGHLLLGLLRLDHQFVSDILDETGATVAGLSAVVLTQMARAA